MEEKSCYWDSNLRPSACEWRGILVAAFTSQVRILQNVIELLFTSKTAALPTRMQPLLTLYDMTGRVLPPGTLLTKWLKNTILTSLMSAMITAR